MSIQDHRSDIQAMVGSGFGTLRHGDFWLLRLDEHMLAPARAWLQALCDSGLVHHCAQLRHRGGGTPAHADESVGIAFSHAGLGRLGFTEQPEAPFPTPFKSGMASPLRAALLGDGTHTDWRWGDAPGSATPPQADVLVVHYRAQPSADAAGLLTAARLQAAGWQVVARVAGCPDYISVPSHAHEAPQFREPFGFRDGLSQPVPRGLREPGPRQGKPQPPETDCSGDHDIEPGEFVLGHRNEYGELAYCPDLTGWHEPARAATILPRFGLNGSYLAVRQIVQDVAAFRRFEAEHPAPDGQASLAERMVGRRKDGQPLLRCPYEPGSANNFRYRVNDALGLQCPRGSHIRRANPRDMLSLDVASGVRASKLHRLLRRGRVYMQGAGDTAEQGLFFIALNASLDRQFEFVQQRWLADHDFGGLRSEDDPIVGRTPTRFTVPALPVGQSVKGFAQFTRVVGGGYFFLPSLSALKFLAGLGPPPTR